MITLYHTHNNSNGLFWTSYLTTEVYALCQINDGSEITIDLTFEYSLKRFTLRRLGNCYMFSGTIVSPVMDLVLDRSVVKFQELDGDFMDLLEYIKTNPKTRMDLMEHFKIEKVLKVY